MSASPRQRLLPSLDLEGALRYDDDPNLAVDWQREATIGLQLRVPLYQGGGEYASVRQVKQVVDQRRNDLESVTRAVREETTTAWQALVTARSRITSIRAQVDAAEIALEGSQREAEVGTAHHARRPRSGKRSVPGRRRPRPGPARRDRREATASKPRSDN